MNLRDLRYLVALADLKHFGRAAAACFVSQPTLSTQIKKFEEELGVSLIERNPRNVLLTEVGAAVVGRARAILREVDEIRSVARRAQNPEAGAVKIGIFPTLGPYLLPHVVPRVVARFPQLELMLFEDKTANLLARLHSGELDAAVLALPVDDESMHAEFLFEEAFVLAVHESSPLAKARNVTLGMLAEQKLLLLDDGHCLRDQALEVCQLAGAIERSGFRATSLETLRHMVSANVGMTLLPTLAVQAPVSPTPHLVLVPFASPAPHRRIALVWRRSSALVPFLLQLAALLKVSPSSARPQATAQGIGAKKSRGTAK